MAYPQGYTEEEYRELAVKIWGDYSRYIRYK